MEAATERRHPEKQITFVEVILPQGDLHFFQLYGRQFL